MAELTFEELTGATESEPRLTEPRGTPVFPGVQAEPESGPATSLGIPQGAPPTFNDLMGIDEGAKDAKIAMKTPDDFSTPVYLANKAKLGMASLLSLGGIPLDFVNELQYMAYDMFGIDVHNKFLDTTRKPLPYGFQKQKDAYEAILFADFDGPEPADFGTRTAGTISEFIGGGLIPGAGIVSKTPGLSNKLIVAGTEITSAVVGGVGFELGGETGKAIDPRLEATGQVVGTTFGALSPYALPASLQAIYGRIAKWMSPATQKQIGREKAIELIKKELGDVPAAMDALGESERLRKNIPGYSPSLGMETDSAGVKSIEKRFAAESSRGFELSKQAEIRSLAAIINRADEMFPGSNFNLTTLPEERLASVRGTFKAEIQTIDDQISNLESTITRGDPEKIGQQLRVLRSQKEEVARAIKNTNYEDFYRAASDANVTFAPETLRTIAKTALGDDALTFQKKSPVINKIVNRYTAPEPDDAATIFVDKNGVPIPGATPEVEAISVREFHSLYKEINREIGIARQGMLRGDSQAAHLHFQLRKLKTEFANNIDVMKSPEFGIVADKLKTADSYFLNQYQKVFREGVGGRMDNYNRFGDVTRDEDIVMKLVMGRASGVDDFYKIYGESQEAQTLLESGVMDAFSRAVMRKGVYKADRATTFLEKHDTTLNKLPELKAILMDKDNAFTALSNRNAHLSAKLKGIQKSKLEQLTDMNDTGELIKAAMADPKRMRTLRRTVAQTGDPDAAKALQHGVARHAMEQTDPFEYFLQNEKVMEIVYGKDTVHYQTLRDLAEARRVISRQFPTQQVSTSLAAEDPLKKLIGTSSVEAMTMARWVNAGRLSPEYVVSQMTSRGVLKFRQEEMNRVMEEALYDPGVAKTLLNMAQEGIIKGSGAGFTESAFAERLKEILFSVGARSTAVTAAKEDSHEE